MRKETRYFVKQILPNGKELFLKKDVQKTAWTKEYRLAQYYGKKRDAKSITKKLKRNVKGTLKIRKLSIKVYKSFFDLPKAFRNN